MNKIEEIEHAVAALPDDDYRAFRQWFLSRDWEKWDHQVEDDSKGGDSPFSSTKPAKPNRTADSENSDGASRHRSLLGRLLGPVA